jgi:hypothetical protein
MDLNSLVQLLLIVLVQMSRVSIDIYGCDLVSSYGMLILYIS